LEFDIAGKLFPNLLTMLVQLGATGLLFYGFKRLLWKPISKYIEKRAEMEDSALANADEANKLAQVNLAHSELSITEAALEAKEIIENGKVEGQRVKSKLVSEGDLEARTKLEAAQREIEHQKAQLRGDIETEIVDVALLAAKRLIEDKVDETSDRALVTAFIKEVRH
jgi:F-type H+-transporting ATPase subunit b